MVNASQPASKSACIGMLAGLVLLGFAGTLVVLTPSSLLEGEFRRLLPAGLPAGLPATLLATGNTTPPPAAGTIVVNNKTYNNSFQAMAAGTPSFGSYNYYSSSFRSSESLTSSSSGSIGDSSTSSFKSSGSAATSVLSVGAWLTGTIWGQLLVWVCFACIYNKKAVAPVLEEMGTLKDKEFEMTGEDDFENGIFDCFDDGWVFCHGWFFPVVRQAQTNAVAGVCGFWETIVCWACCAMLSANLGPCCLLVMWRRQVKEVMGVEDHLINDLCCTLVCPLLSICQMGSAVDRASGYETTGLCTLEKV